MKAIAFSGFKQSGKDSCANFLVENYGFRRISFADPLKDMVADQFDIPRHSLDDPKYKEQPLDQYPAPATDSFTSVISNFMVREFRTLDGFPPSVKDLRTERGVLQTFLNGWENLYHTPRSLAILLGSGMRSGTPSFWVDKAIKNIKQSDHSKFVISDLRYKSEVNNLRVAFEKELVTIRINRFDSSPSIDPSELDLVGHKHDFEIENRGTKEELFAKIQELMSRL